MTAAFVFVLGTIVGSFLNVCIFRVPAGESFIGPSSHCRNCRKKIAWYDLIPVISFILLKRRCRHCKKKISFQYAFNEILAGILFVLFYLVFGITLKGVVYLVFTLALLVGSMIDLSHRIIPDG